MDMFIGFVIGTVLAALISGFIIWIVSKLNLGLHVESFGWAMLAGLLIGVVGNAIMRVVPIGNDIVHVAVNLVVSAAVIFLCGALLRGVTVKGFGGALIAAVAIAVVGFILALVVLSGATAIGRVGTP